MEKEGRGKPLRLKEKKTSIPSSSTRMSKKTEATRGRRSSQATTKKENKKNLELQKKS